MEQSTIQVPPVLHRPTTTKLSASILRQQLHEIAELANLHEEGNMSRVVREVLRQGLDRMVTTTPLHRYGPTLIRIREQGNGQTD